MGTGLDVMDAWDRKGSGGRSCSGDGSGSRETGDKRGTG